MENVGLRALPELEMLLNLSEDMAGDYEKAKPKAAAEGHIRCSRKRDDRSLTLQDI